SPKGSSSPKTTFSPLGTEMRSLGVMFKLVFSASPRNSFGSVPSNSFSSEGSVETVPAQCVPTEEETLFAKHSPRREQPSENISLTEYGSSFSESYKIQMDEEAGPSNRGSLGCFRCLVKSIAYLVVVGFEDFDQEIMAQVLAESQKTYL